SLNADELTDACAVTGGPQSDVTSRKRRASPDSDSPSEHKATGKQGLFHLWRGESGCRSCSSWMSDLAHTNTNEAGGGKDFGFGFFLRANPRGRDSDRWAPTFRLRCTS